jgi:hypothetical protein
MSFQHLEQSEVVWFGVVWCGVVWCGVHIADLKFKKMGYYIDNFYFFYCAHFCPQPLPVF